MKPKRYVRKSQVDSVVAGAIKPNDGCLLQVNGRVPLVRMNIRYLDLRVQDNHTINEDSASQMSF